MQGTQTLGSAMTALASGDVLVIGELAVKGGSDRAGRTAVSCACVLAKATGVKGRGGGWKKRQLYSLLYTCSWDQFSAGSFTVCSLLDLI